MYIKWIRVRNVYSEVLLTGGMRQGRIDTQSHISSALPVPQCTRPIQITLNTCYELDHHPIFDSTYMTCPCCIVY